MRDEMFEDAEKAARDQVSQDSWEDAYGVAPEPNNNSATSPVLDEVQAGNESPSGASITTKDAPASVAEKDKRIGELEEGLAKVYDLANECYEMIGALVDAGPTVEDVASCPICGKPVSLEGHADSCEVRWFYCSIVSKFWIPGRPPSEQTLLEVSGSTANLEPGHPELEIAHPSGSVDATTEPTNKTIDSQEKRIAELEGLLKRVADEKNIDWTMKGPGTLIYDIRAALSSNTSQGEG